MTSRRALSAGRRRGCTTLRAGGRRARARLRDPPSEGARAGLDARRATTPRFPHEAGESATRAGTSRRPAPPGPGPGGREHGPLAQEQSPAPRQRGSGAGCRTSSIGPARTGDCRCAVRLDPERRQQPAAASASRRDSNGDADGRPYGSGTGVLVELHVGHQPDRRVAGFDQVVARTLYPGNVRPPP